MTRLLLLAGQFNYGTRGILDLTHTRLFTFSTLRRALDGAGFRVVGCVEFPRHFPSRLGDSGPARALISLNSTGNRCWKRFFAYQIYAIAQPRPSLDLLLRDATSPQKFAPKRWPGIADATQLGARRTLYPVALGKNRCGSCSNVEMYSR